MHTPTRLRRLLWLFLLLLPGSTLLADDTRWYKVEVILFSQGSQTYRDSEHWPRDYRLPNRQAAIELLPAGGQQAFSQLGQNDLQLGAEAGRIRADGNLSLLLHTGWRQPGLPADQAKGVLIRVNDPQYEDQDALSPPRLEGVLTVSLSRYLHMNADLLYRAYRPNATLAEPSAQPQTVPTFLADEPLADLPETSPWQIYRMEESRRMRSNELHYLDHPLFGMLVLITPL